MKPVAAANTDGKEKGIERDFLLMNVNSVQENGQIRSFAELAGEALNFHKPGERVFKETRQRRIDMVSSR